jgi:hypothetical protein
VLRFIFALCQGDTIRIAFTMKFARDKKDEGFGGTVQESGRVVQFSDQSEPRP